MKSSRLVLLRRALLAAASSASVLAGGSATASVPTGYDAEADLAVVPNHTVTPGPGNPATGANYGNSPQVLDIGINGVGQQIAFIQGPNSPNSAGLSLCSGTLINPRTVITAAHCVYSRPAHNYGSYTGTAGAPYGAFAAPGLTGTPISFGFSSTNRCLGVAVNGCAVGEGAYEAWRNSGFKTIADKAIYNGNQVWYLRGAEPVATGGGGEFANGDIALVTLDTHAKGVPTWTMLFSPLDGPTHTTITGYGGTGVGQGNIGSLAGIDYRRRAAENMIDALMSWHDQNTTGAISGPNSTARIIHQHPIYWMDFDDPNYSNTPPANFFNNTAAPGQRNNGYYDFNGLGGGALPLEASTAGGDSGGPLVVDQRWDKKVIAGVLTGSISYNGGISTYGQFNVYPPLFQFWQDIVANNPYVYASAKAGIGDWHDPTRWVQDMDPNYAIVGANGELLTGVPDTTQGGGDEAGTKFGTVSFLGEDCFVNAAGGEDCGTITGSGPRTGDGTPVYTAGGPNSTNFVPDNIEPLNSADAALHKKARYFDVTLRNVGLTTVTQSATIDKLTIDGPSALSIKAGGSLNVLTDFHQLVGITNVDGLLKANEAMIGAGLLSGRGTIDTPYLNVVLGAIAPGGIADIGTLTVDGNVMLASGAVTLVDVKRGASDRLVVIASQPGEGVLSLGGSVVFNKVGSAPRHGEKAVIATATGGIENEFDAVYSLMGVLRPDLTYNANDVTVLLRAGKFSDYIKGYGAVVDAFAAALDALRGNDYASLYGLYGSIDLMEPDQLAATLQGFNPAIVGETRSLQDRQSKVMLSAITDRLSMLGTGSLAGSLSIVGQPGAVVAFNGQSGAVPTQTSLTQGLRPAGTSFTRLPKGMSGFVSGGFTADAASYGDGGRTSGQRAWHMGMGLEMEVAENMTLGTAFGYSNGYSMPGSDASRTDSRMTQAAAYGSYRLGGGAYVAGLAVAEKSRSGIDRSVLTGDAMFDLAGATTASRYNLQAEAGVTMGLWRGLTLTPRASLGYASYSFGGYREIGGEAALQIDDLKAQRLEARIGARLAGSARFGAGWTLVPQLAADYVRNLSGAEDGMQVRFAAAPEHAFLLPLAGGDGSYAEVRGGLNLTNGPLEFGAGVESSLGRSYVRDDRAVADFTLRF